MNMEVGSRDFKFIYDFEQSSQDRGRILEPSSDPYPATKNLHLEARRNWKPYNGRFVRKTVA